MATSGLLKTNTAYDSYFWVKWKQSGNQDTANNRTLIEWSCGVYCGHNFYSNAIKMSAVTINGTQVYKGGTYSNYSTGDHTIASGTMWISHNTDGKKKFSIADFTGWLYSNNNYSAKSTEYTLEDIPRQATITSATNFTDEDNPSFTFSNPANATLSCWLEPNPTGDHLCSRTLSGSSGTFTWKLTEDERKQLRKACSGKSCVCRIGLYSTIGSTTYASVQDKTLSIVNANPTFTADEITYTDTSAVTNITSNPLHIVQNQSTLAVTVKEATAKKEATISRYDVTVNGVKKTATVGKAVDFGKINTSSNTDISVTVTDSRGNTTTAKKTVTILPWALPIFTASLERKNNYEDETYLTVDASVSSVNGKNTMNISYQRKESGGDYDDAEPIENKTQKTIQCDKNKAYIFTITVADAFDAATHDFVLGKGKFPLFIDTQKNAVGINDFPAEGEALRVVDGVGNFVDGIMINGINVADFPIELGTSGIWTYKKWNSGEVELWGLATLNTFGDTRHIYVNSMLPFPFVGYPITVMSLYRAEAYTYRQGSIVLSSVYEAGKSTIRLSMIRNEGGLASGNTAEVNVHIKGRWK